METLVKLTDEGQVYMGSRLVCVLGHGEQVTIADNQYVLVVQRKPQSPKVREIRLRRKKGEAECER